MRVEFAQFRGRLLNVFLTPENKFRNDLIERVNPYLERDEHVQRLFVGSTGPSPYLAISIMIAVFSLLARSRIVAVTNRSIVVFSTGGFRANRPKAIIRRLPRQTRLGPVKGSTSRVAVGPETLWVAKHFYDEIEAADASLKRQLPPNEAAGRDPRGGGSAAIFLFLGPAICILGIQDAVSGGRDQYRLLGISFAITGLLMLIAAIGLSKMEWGASWGSPIGTLAGMGGLFVGIYIAGTQVTFPRPSFWVLFWGILILLMSIVAVWRLPWSGLRSGLQGTGKRLAALGISSALLWNIVVFIYQNQYLPIKAGSILTLATTLSDTGKSSKSSGLHTFLATISVKNPTTTKVQTITSLYTVIGFNISRVEENADFSASTGDSPTPRYSQERVNRVLEYGPVLPPNKYFEPGEESTGNFLVDVPEDAKQAYDGLRLLVRIIAANGSLLALEDLPSYGPKEAPGSNDGSPPSSRMVIMEQPIRQLSQIRNLTRGSHAVTVLRYLPGTMDKTGGNDNELEETPWIDACIDTARRINEELIRNARSICNDNEGRVKLRRSYGMVNTFATAELAILERKNRVSQPKNSRPFRG